MVLSSVHPFRASCYKMDPNGNDGQESDPDEGIELYDDDNDMPAGNFIWLCYMFYILFRCCIHVYLNVCLLSLDLS